ncbi:MAG TPA: hypothetical protein VEY33_05560 [Gemmatimonadota bacterium]|nr:hypothetical protein [Gemmatimonadota bacterium]
MSRAGARPALVASSGALLFFLLGAPHATADPATADEVRSLARRADTAPGALERLKNVDSVDGHPVDLATALGDAEPEELAERLKILAEEPPASPSISSEQARQEAGDVLTQGKFKERDIPRPFRGILDEIGERLRPVGEWFVELANDLTGGRPEWLLALLAAIVVVVSILVARRIIHKRTRDAVDRPRTGLDTAGLDARELESQADEAERNGLLETAIRLRFKAGLVRLAESGAIPSRASLTSEEIAEFVRSRDFEEIAATFDEVVYGRRAPAQADVVRSGTGWAAVLRSRSRS